MDILNAFPGKYRKACDFEKPATLTIAKVYKERIGRNNDEKPVIYFTDEEDQRGIVMNRTNATFLAGQFGRDTAKWTGKQVEAYSTKVQFGADMVDSIRFREPPEPFHDDDVPDFSAA